MWTGVSQSAAPVRILASFGRHSDHKHPRSYLHREPMCVAVPTPQDHADHGAETRLELSDPFVRIGVCLPSTHRASCCAPPAWSRTIGAGGRWTASTSPCTPASE